MSLSLSSSTFYLLCVAAGLFVASTTSAAIVWHTRRASARQLKAIALLDALVRSSEWVDTQARALRFQGRTQVRDPALQEIGLLQARWFPELEAAVQVLFERRARMARLLREHRRHDLDHAEQLLESGADATFMKLRGDHARIVQFIEQRLAPYATGDSHAPIFTS